MSSKKKKAEKSENPISAPAANVNEVKVASKPTAAESAGNLPMQAIEQLLQVVDLGIKKGAFTVDELEFVIPVYKKVGNFLNIAKRAALAAQQQAQQDSKGVSQ